MFACNETSLQIFKLCDLVKFFMQGSEGGEEAFSLLPAFLYLLTYSPSKAMMMYILFKESGLTSF